MADFNFYLNRQGVRGKKGDKGDQGYSPNISIKTDTPTEFIMTVNNEFDSFDTPNLIPQAVREEITKLEATVTTHTGQISTLNNEYNAVTDRLDAHTDDLMQIIQKNNQQDTAIDNIQVSLQGQSDRIRRVETDVKVLKDNTNRIAGDVQNLESGKQNKLVQGDNVTLTDNSDGTTTISATGSGGQLPDNVAVTDNGNTFHHSQTILNDNFSYIGLSIGQENSEYLGYIDQSKPNISISGDKIGFDGSEDGHTPTISVQSSELPLSIFANKLTLNNKMVLTNDDIVQGNNITVTKDETTGRIIISATDSSPSDTPIATTEVAGKVKPDGTTITVTEDGTISATGGGSAPENMVTTNTTQTITGDKTFSGNLTAGNINIGEYLALHSHRSGANQYSQIQGNAYVNHFNTGTGGGCWAFSEDPRYSDGIENGESSSQLTTYQPYLRFGNITVGDNISIEQTRNNSNEITGIKISSSGGSSTPTNMVTIDTEQTITGEKTFTLDSGSAFKIGRDQANNRIGLQFQSNSSTKNFQISNTGYTNSSLTFTNFGGGVNITPTYGDGTLTVGGGADRLVYTKSDGTVVDLLAGGGGSIDNLVTLDTEQDISGKKTFTNADGLTIGNYPATAIIKNDRFTFNDGYNETLSFTSNYVAGNGGYATLSSNAELTIKNNVIAPIILSPYPNNLHSLKYKSAYSDNRPSHTILHTGNIKAGDGISITTNNDSDETLIISATGGSSGSVDEKYGIEGDYATHYGIVDNPNGIIEFSVANKDITVKQGLVLNCAGNGAAKTTISGDITHTVTTTGTFTLFYANGNLLECGKVDYSVTEPEDNGVENYQAWFNPDKIVNPSQQWQFKSNDTGNVFRAVDSATPIANIVAGETGITSVSYIGYRIIDDDVFAKQSDVVTLSSAQIIEGKKTFLGSLSINNSLTRLSQSSYDLSLSIDSSANGDGGLRCGNITTSQYGNRIQMPHVISGTNRHYNVMGYPEGDLQGKFIIGSTTSDYKTENPDGETTIYGKLVNSNGNKFLTESDKSEITGWGFPTTGAQKLTFGANGTEYTAPENGYFQALCKATAQAGAILLLSLVTGLQDRKDAHSASTPMVIKLKVSKGEQVSLQYNNIDSSDIFFVPVKGDV